MLFVLSTIVWKVEDGRFIIWDVVCAARESIVCVCVCVWRECVCVCVCLYMHLYEVCVHVRDHLSCHLPEVVSFFFQSKADRHNRLLFP